MKLDVYQFLLRRPPDPGVLERQAGLVLHQEGDHDGPERERERERLKHLGRHHCCRTCTMHCLCKLGEILATPAQHADLCCAGVMSEATMSGSSSMDSASSKSSWSSSQKAWVSLISDGGRLNAEGNLIW